MIERQVRKSAAAILLESGIGAQFDAVVTGASDKRTWVRLCIRPLKEDWRAVLKAWKVGHRLRVQVVRTDVERGYIDFKRAA